MGPNEVLQRIGPVAYKLRLRVESKIHRTFHVSRLKPTLSSCDVYLRSMPFICTDDDLLALPFKVLDIKLLSVEDKQVHHVLVHWEGTKLNEVTWIPCREFLKKFLGSNLVGKALQRGGN